MSSTGNSRDPDGDRPFAEPESEPTKDRSEDPGLLDRVLQETLALTNPDSPLSQQDMEALIEVARRHATAEITVDAVVELIQIVLRSRFKSIAENERSFSEMSREIAVTVRDDARTWERVESFWARLCEAAK